MIDIEMPSRAGDGDGDGSPPTPPQSGFNRPRPMTRTAPPAVSLPPLFLALEPRLQLAEFEERWQQLDTRELWGATLATVPTEEALLALMQPARVFCMASGRIDAVQKFYFYAEEVCARKSTARRSDTDTDSNARRRAHTNSSWRRSALLCRHAASPRFSSLSLGNMRRLSLRSSNASSVNSSKKRRECNSQ